MMMIMIPNRTAPAAMGAIIHTMSEEAVDMLLLGGVLPVRLVSEVSDKIGDTVERSLSFGIMIVEEKAEDENEWC